MERVFLLILLFAATTVSSNAQNTDSLSEQKSSTRYEHPLDSSAAKSLKRVAIGNATAISVHLVCTCSHNTTKPLFLVKTHHETFICDSLSMINPNWISDLYVTKKPEEITPYGDEAKAGIIIITLNEKKYPEAYRSLIHRLRKLKPNFAIPKHQSVPIVVNIR
jgi:hypothetical protein